MGETFSTCMKTDNISNENISEDAHEILNDNKIQKVLGNNNFIHLTIK